MPVKTNSYVTMNDPLKKYRIQFRIWKNDLRLKREGRYYESAFASRHLTIPDEETIRQEMRKRFPHIRPKDKGTLKHSRHISPLYLGK